MMIKCPNCSWLLQLTQDPVAELKTEEEGPDKKLVVCIICSSIIDFTREPKIEKAVYINPAARSTVTINRHALKIRST